MSDPDPTLAVAICLVPAALLTTPAIAYCGQRTLNDSTRYVNTVGPLVDSPQVLAGAVPGTTR